MDKRFSEHYDQVSDTTKKSRRRTFVAADSEIDTVFMEMDIRKYCPKKIFDIIIINEVNEKSQLKMQEIIDNFRKFEEVSYVTFIKYVDILDLLDNYEKKVFPQEIRNSVMQILDDMKLFLARKKHDVQIPLTKTALLLKIKLIEVMHLHYKRELHKLERRNELISELNKLTRTKKSKDLEDDTDRLDDVNDVNDVIFDDDIFNHVWFYAIEGIFNAKLIAMLLTGKIPITAILKVDMETECYIEPESIHARFWSEMDELLFAQARLESLENTMALKFTIKNKDNEDVFKDLLYVIKYISEIKFQHLNYIRHLQVYDFNHIKFEHQPLNCLKIYNKLVHSLPLELVTDVVILSSMLEETVFQVDGVNNLSKYNIPKPKNPAPPCKPDYPELSIAAQYRPPTKKYVRTPPHHFQCYHNDSLKTILHTYKSTGEMVYNLSMNVLKCIHPFNLLDDLMVLEGEGDRDHVHDLDPGKERQTERQKELHKQIVNHFINLFIFSTFQYVEKPLTPTEKEGVLEHVLMFDQEAFEQNLRPRLMEKDAIKPEEPLTYDSSPMDFCWKEEYPPYLLMQEILKSQSNYNYVDTIYCPQTSKVLLQFSDWLDDFGINTRIYNQSLVTPVCLRDFCRYTVRELVNWSKENPPPKYVRKSEQAEICKGARNLMKNESFEEYRYLLECEGDNMSLMQHPSDTEVNEVTFDEMMKELEMYPPNTKLKEEYKKQNYRKDFMGYDFGTKYFGIRGARTTFSSHDGVKVYVDSTKFIDEGDKCTIALHYKENKLVMHSSVDFFRNYYTFHMLLADETIVVFEMQKKRKGSRLETDSSLEPSGGRLSQRDSKKPSHFEIQVRTEQQSFVEQTAEEEANIYTALIEAIDQDREIYKLKKEYTFVKEKVHFQEIPLSSVIYRLVTNLRKKARKKPEFDPNKSRRFIPLHAPSAIPVMESMTFKITLPSGVQVSCYPSVIKENLVEVKQELLVHNVEMLDKEEFRLFTREGFIVIKYLDGSLRMLMSNGNIIDFDKPNTNHPGMRKTKEVYQKTLSNIKKRLNRLMISTERVKTDYYESRRSGMVKRGYILNNDMIKILESYKLPYKRTTLLSFEGLKTIMENDCLTQKRVYYTKLENDMCEKEMYYEREDGMRCILHNSGDKIVEYSDGTRITCTVAVHSDLVDGYVFISVFYKYEHPNFATVSYNDADLLQINLNNVELKKTKDGTCTLTIDKFAKVVTDTEHVLFEKNCPKCHVPFKCNFDISPLYTNTVELTKVFGHVTDSYKKHFFVDFSGVCRTNRNHLTGVLNTANCNHVENNTYKQLYTLNKSKSGEQLIRVNTVEKYKEQLLDDHNTKVINTKSSKSMETLRIYKHFYQEYPDRLLTQNTLNNPIVLSKYRKPIERVVHYTSVKVLTHVISENKLLNLLNYLNHQLEHIEMSDRLKKLIRNITDKKKEEAEVKKQKLMEIQRQKDLEDRMQCKCVKDKRTFSRKVMLWKQEYERLKELVKNAKIPPYFHSEFCQTVRRYK